MELYKWWAAAGILKLSIANLSSSKTINGAGATDTLQFMGRGQLHSLQMLQWKYSCRWNKYTVTVGSKDFYLLQVGTGDDTFKCLPYGWTKCRYLWWWKSIQLMWRYFRFTTEYFNLQVRCFGTNVGGMKT